MNNYEERASKALDRNSLAAKKIVDWRRTKIGATQGARDSDPWRQLGIKFRGHDVESEMRSFGTMLGNLDEPREARNTRSYALDSAEEIDRDTLAKIAGLRHYFSTLGPNECVRPAVVIPLLRAIEDNDV
jgi:hypothetical protein